MPEPFGGSQQGPSQGARGQSGLAGIAQQRRKVEEDLGQDVLDKPGEFPHPAERWSPSAQGLLCPRSGCPS